MCVAFLQRQTQNRESIFYFFPNKVSRREKKNSFNSTHKHTVSVVEGSQKKKKKKHI